MSIQTLTSEKVTVAPGLTAGLEIQPPDRATRMSYARSTGFEPATSRLHTPGRSTD